MDKNKIVYFVVTPYNVDFFQNREDVDNYMLEFSKEENISELAVYEAEVKRKLRFSFQLKVDEVEM